MNYKLTKYNNSCLCWRNFVSRRKVAQTSQYYRCPFRWIPAPMLISNCRIIIVVELWHSCLYSPGKCYGL